MFLELPAKIGRFQESFVDYYQSYYVITNEKGREICRVFRWTDGENDEDYLKRVEELVRRINNYIT